MMNPAWPETIDCGRPDPPLPNGPQSHTFAPEIGQGFGQGSKPAKSVRAGLYARVSTHDQQTIPLQTRALREFAAQRGWIITVQVKEIGSGASEPELREKLLEAARRREIDVVLVWRLDRWGRSLADLVATLQELSHLGVGFVFADRGPGPDTPSGRAMAGMLAVFAEFDHEILRERVGAGLAQARQNGQRLGSTNEAIADWHYWVAQAYCF